MKIREEGMQLNQGKFVSKGYDRPARVYFERLIRRTARSGDGKSQECQKRRKKERSIIDLLV